jgi:DNA-binding MarR family transcriptional regulator
MQVAGAGTPPDPLIEAVLQASRAMVGLAARSLAEVTDELSLGQYRALISLEQGPMRPTELGHALGLTASAGSRLCERLVRKGLVRRWQATEDRRVAQVALTPAGWDLIERVSEQRRAEIAGIVQALPEEKKGLAVDVLREFVTAAGTHPKQSWSAGWGTEGEAVPP